MGNNTSLPCCQAPSDKYEVPPGYEGEVAASDALPAKDESHTEGKAGVAKPPPSEKKAFATTDPLEVAAELAPQQGLPYQFHICGPPPPPCDDLRLRTINALKSAGSVKMDADAIDAPPDPEIASILKLVQSIFEAPAALVALFDDRRIFVRDAEGAFKRGDFPWRWSFCGWTMASKNDQIMVIPDATKDARFCNNAMVTSGPGVRFYCGTPLIASNGHRIGTLCFADVKPREFDASRCVVLNNLAELVVRHLEKDIALQLRAHHNHSLAAAYGNLRRTLDCFDHCVALLDTGTPGWRILFVNNPCCKALGIDRESLQGSYLSRLLAEKGGSMLPTDENQITANKGQEFQVMAQLSRVVIEEFDEKAEGGKGERSAAEERRFILTFRPASREDLDEGTLSIGVPSFIPVEAKKQLLEDADPTSSSSNTSDSQGTAQRRPDKLYFMLLQDAAIVEAQRAAAKAAAEAKAAADLKAANSSVGLSTAQSSLISSHLHDKELSQPPESIRGLSMGHLLGKGAYGSVYYGTWYGSAVAVKIIDEELPPGVESIAPPIEAILSKELRHPHIVATLRCACRIVSPTGSSRTASSSAVATTAAALRRSGMAANDGGSAATFSDDTARVSRAMTGVGTGSAVGTPSGGSMSGGMPCVVPRRRGGISGQGSSTSTGLPDSGWLQGDLNARTSAQPNSAMGSAQSSKASQPAGDQGVAANGDGAAAAAANGAPAADGDGAATNLLEGASQSPSQRQSQAGWAIIDMGAAQAGHRPSSLARQSAAQGVAAAETPPAANGGEAVTPEGSTDNSEAYDDFDAGRDSSMSPFLLPPGSNPAGGGGGATGLPGHSGPSGGPSEKWAQDEVLIRHQTWLIMEYCDRGCLQDAIDRGWLRVSAALENSGPRMDAVLATALELASALAFLHSKDIVHGDLSAWNVMLCTSGSTAAVGGRNFVAKIADFGLARHLDIRTKIETRTYGTLTHMPAETLRDGVVSKATDVYSLGVLLWQMYTSSRPWAGLRHGQIIVMVVTQGARLRFPPGCPPAYEDLALACMESNSSRRPAIESVLEQLEAIRKDLC
ncbi:hypothetical protein PLESTB_000832900 [Pleodorina starrii]|uniref:Protein kinase domain-containing protein n=1 Tax=Pleodorina starrii TaxID=330485 RepID=A0A9W6BMB5_9CHLO|nr:hypothetical protein PLESTM_000148800 [Pleodorina starrii]GLC54187.1 hypothetical protein PLESTB_000832900 [Pleodorina starrii]